ncbi:alpha/beta fold hydrolase [Stutzerimonas azotifigens]|uniref:Alpha/beta hydrolase n=1 Tax=Stutzerimonas azotifigens TaxID=291995 RepID=A0ABR5Z2F9_9GAMM|nr:alpha/beta hydrolase [Stutzerimonas azotifigens]MBA1274415.1 alpha/beta hydrolase [Stutzerimonas azotifigens]
MTHRQYLETEAATLEYRFLHPSNSTGPTLVLLHEGLGSLDLWKDFPAQLAEACAAPVLIYSRQGYGRSSPVPLPRPLDYLSVDGPDELGRVLDGLALEQVVLVGHSDGASIALAYAARQDPRVDGVVVLAPHVDVEPVSVEGVRRTVKAYTRGDLRERLHAYHGDNLDGAFRGWSETWLNPAFAAWNLYPELLRIQVPLLAIQGREDEFATPAQLETIAREVVGPCRTVLLEHCRHFPQNQARPRVLALIAQFLATLPR